MEFWPPQTTGSDRANTNPCRSYGACPGIQGGRCYKHGAPTELGSPPSPPHPPQSKKLARGPRLALVSGQLR